jgi:hypothetical protein
MERTRFIAAAPIRSASEAWDIVCQLLTSTLERSSSVTSGSVATELQRLKGLGPALIAGGHLEKKGLLLTDENLDVSIQILTGDAALDIEENLNPIPGGASATSGWKIYLQEPGPLSAALSAAINGSTHLCVGKPGASTRTVKIENPVNSLIDMDALRSLGGRS